MACDFEDNWNFTVVKSGSFARVIAFENEDETPMNLNGVTPVMVIKFGAGEILTLGSPKLAVQSPAADGKILIDFSAADIAAFTFRTARYFIFLERNGIRGEEMLAGTVTVK